MKFSLMPIAQQISGRLARQKIGCRASTLTDEVTSTYPRHAISNFSCRNVSQITAGFLPANVFNRPAHLVFKESPVLLRLLQAVN